MSTGHELYRQGRLADAIAAMNAEVKAHPTDLAARGFLAELLCFDGNHQRVDLLLDQMAGLDASLAVPLALLRQLVRADVARQQFHEEGRLPEFLDAPTPWVKGYLQASILVREGKLAEAAGVLAAAEAERPRVAGSHDGTDFDDFRDLDDLAPGILEVYTSTGKFFWIPLERVRELEFRPPQRPRDLLWRQAFMLVENGPEGEVYLPALYAGSMRATDEALKLGRATEWVGAEGEPVRGVGQRSFLLGEIDVPMLELGRLTFTAA